MVGSLRMECNGIRVRCLGVDDFLERCTVRFGWFGMVISSQRSFRSFLLMSMSMVRRRYVRFLMVHNSGSFFHLGDPYRSESGT